MISLLWNKLKLKQQKDLLFYTSQIKYLEDFISNKDNVLLVDEMGLNNQLQNVKNLHQEASTDQYLSSLIGTIGADPLYRK